MLLLYEYGVSQCLLQWCYIGFYSVLSEVMENNGLCECFIIDAVRMASYRSVGR